MPVRLTDKPCKTQANVCVLVEAVAVRAYIRICDVLGFSVVAHTA